MREEPFNLGRYRCRIIYNQVPGTPIIFLHGYNFTSNVWRDIGVLDELEREKIPYAAIDMPYGARSVCSPRSRDPGENIWVAHEVVRGLFPGSKPLIVGASLGGYIALKYATTHPVAGLFLIAPVNGLERELVEKYKSLTIPVIIVWGSKDRVVSLDELRKLAEHLEAQLTIYENAKHPAYLDYPERFKKDLIAFYKAIHLE